jgi:hypothetical protein
VGLSAALKEVEEPATQGRSGFKELQVWCRINGLRACSRKHTCQVQAIGFVREIFKNFIGRRQYIPSQSLHREMIFEAQNDRTW